VNAFTSVAAKRAEKASDLRKRTPLTLTASGHPRILPALMTGHDQGGGAWAGMGVGWAITSTLIAGMLVVGGIGYLLDLVFGSGRVLTGVGFVVGAAGGIYAVYVRYGKGERDGYDDRS
jgi:hypothetical protein